MGLYCPIHLSVRPSFHPSIHPSVRPSFHSSFHPSVQQIDNYSTIVSILSPGNIRVKVVRAFFFSQSLYFRSTLPDKIFCKMKRSLPVPMRKSKQRNLKLYLNWILINLNLNSHMWLVFTILDITDLECLRRWGDRKY